MSRPILAFLTDFGYRDPYVGAMKGAALSVCPDATLVDLTHDIAPHDVLEGALHLAAAHRYFPRGTAFVAVVDPGVGSARRALAAEAGGCYFVAPDNGILTVVLREAPGAPIVALAERRFARPLVSRTFEGRDRFAPAAAWLLRGVPLAELGPAVADPHQLAVPAPERRADGLYGAILRADRFGNLLTTLDRATVDEFAQGRPVRIEAGGRPFPLVETYADIPEAAACALYGSTDHLELARRAAPASDLDGLGPGVPVVVRHL